MDLVNPASDKMDEGLHSLGFKTKDEIVGQKTLQFDISQFMTCLLYTSTPSIGVLDIRIERGFGDSFPGGTVEPMSYNDATNDSY